ncbi:type II toxin-antitoxin system HicB family antitoxin [Tepidimonas sp.]|uniref:type II toxin-antitoxin system HicB family antitoxin n=1 Tax=Tepidimonas sp. TaxID=2002775 RepID=UPI002FDF2C50
MNIAYPYTLEPQPEGGYLVQFVDLEEAFTEGDTEEQAAFNAAEVLTGVLAVRLEQGEGIPPPSPALGRPVAIPDAPVQAALLIHFARQGHSLSELARAMGTSWPAAQRLTRPGNPTLKQLERAAAALGKRLVLSLE